MKLKHHFILSLCLAFTLNLSAQSTPKCGQRAYIDYLDHKYPGFKSASDKQFEMVKRKPADLTVRNPIYHIPVVFHIIYYSEKQNIADSVISRQLEILNQAYRNSHPQVNDTRDEFKPLAADAEIEFYLASKDPEGNPSNGITRTLSTEKYFGDIGILLGIFDIEQIERIKYTTQGGFDGWPSNEYLNVWVADMGFSFLGQDLFAILGLATPPRFPALPDNWPPGAIDGIKDGVIIQYQAIGDNNPNVSDLLDLTTKGRTLVHEVGHYLGLRHINGDESDCSGTDGIDDTPNMNFSEQGTECPTALINSCVDSLNDLPDMWENYMDYSNDKCQTLFTYGQVGHMRKVLKAQRDSLLLSSPSVILKTKMQIYPTIAQEDLYLYSSEEYTDYSIFDLTGNEVIRQKITSERISIRELIQGYYVIVATKRDGTLQQASFRKQ